MLDSNSATVFRIVSKRCDVYNDCIFWNKIYLHYNHDISLYISVSITVQKEDIYYTILT